MSDETRHIKLALDLAEDALLEGRATPEYTEVLRNRVQSVQGLLLAAPDLLAALRALVDAPVRYNGKQIEIECGSHADAMSRVANARAAISKATKPPAQPAQGA